MVAAAVVDRLEMVDVDQREQHARGQHVLVVGGHAPVQRDVAGDVQRQVAAIAQLGQVVGEAGVLQALVRRLQRLGALAHLPLQGCAQALVDHPRHADAEQRQCQHAQPEQQLVQQRFLEAQPDPQRQPCRRLRPDPGVVAAGDLEHVVAAGQVGIAGHALADVVQAAPLRVVADQAIAQFHVLRRLERGGGELEIQVARLRRQRRGAQRLWCHPAALRADPLHHRLRRDRVLDDAGGVHGHHAVAAGQPQGAAVDEALAVAGAVAAQALHAAVALAAFVEQQFGLQRRARYLDALEQARQRHPVHAAQAGHPQAAVAVVGDEERRVRRQSGVFVEHAPALAVEHPQLFRQRAHHPLSAGQFVHGGDVGVGQRRAGRGERQQALAVQFVQAGLGADQQAPGAGLVDQADARVAQARALAVALQAHAVAAEQAVAGSEP